ncbi:conserved hypothetical protein [Coccidioides posadasii str. Silveira]|uniref:Uncharacterized protein n=1 Tax=Coccidioides posadasii (strain RMSCC 757 / Silveira) TaxID=443226 RepID=E9CS61_COCPS|nr:conserved hypothetical protein [Coccidioides posadasii str. Silveira]
MSRGQGGVEGGLSTQRQPSITAKPCCNYRTLAAASVHPPLACLGMVGLRSRRAKWAKISGVAWLSRMRNGAIVGDLRVTTSERSHPLKKVPYRTVWTEELSQQLLRPARHFFPVCTHFQGRLLVDLKPKADQPTWVIILDVKTLADQIALMAHQPGVITSLSWKTNFSPVLNPQGGCNEDNRSQRGDKHLLAGWYWHCGLSGFVARLKGGLRVFLDHSFSVHCIRPLSFIEI